MEAKEAKQQLKEEGFDSVFVVKDPPGRFYAEHTHEGVTAHIVIEGSMEVVVQGRKETYHPGDRFDVPAGAKHTATAGRKGCKYVVGEK